MTYLEIITKVAKDNDLPISLVDKTYKSFWKVIRQHISELPLKEDLTDEEFLKLKPNVNIPSIGKLYVTLDRYRSIKNSYNSVMDKYNATHQENKTVV